MKTGSAWLSIAALLVSGVAIGALGMHLYHERVALPPPGPAGPPPLEGPRRGGFLLRDMESTLDLTAAQREQIRGILRESRETSEAMRREFRPRLREHMERTLEQIDDVLTEDQRRRFAELRRRHRGRAERFLLGERRPRR